MKRFLVAIIFFHVLAIVRAQVDPLLASDVTGQQAWVNSTFEKLTLEEQVGQLFMILATSETGNSNSGAISEAINEHKIGGVLFSRGGPVAQAKLTNKFQRSTKTPLLIGMDAEWGLAMRLDSTFAFPYNMTLGAVKDDKLVAEVGKRIGTHAKRLGIHINFGPVVDINTNPYNPIIGNRSFGESRENVARKGLSIAKGLREAGVMACGKHFPGHGDTSQDSHKTLPTVEFEASRLDSVELHPYKQMIADGLEAVMVAHLDIPSLGTKTGSPTSLSKKVITDLLRKELGFQGLIVSDALNMKAVTQDANAGETAVKAFLAGNDILLMPEDLEKAVEAVTEAVNRGRISKQRLESSVRKILKAKYKAGLHRSSTVKTKGIIDDLITIKDSILAEEIYEAAVTVVSDDLGLIGIRNLENKKIAYVKLGDADGNVFLETLRKYAPVSEVSGKDVGAIKRRLKDYNLVIVGFHKSDKNPWQSYELDKKDLYWLQEIAEERSSNLIFTSFTSPYSLRPVANLNGIDAVVAAYQNNEIAQETAAEVLFGAVTAKGKLPVTAATGFTEGLGKATPSLKRLGYSLPERVGIDSEMLQHVDELVQNGLDSLMYPGAQVLIARRGKVIYNKGFGSPVYDTEENVTPNHIYDLASLTKILATLPLVMRMEEEGHITLNSTFKDLIPQYHESELRDVTVLKALSHYGRLPAWIAFYLDTLNEDSKPSPAFYRNYPSDGFSIKITDQMYLTDAYKDSIYNRIGRQELKSNRYRYSDVAYYVLKKFIEEQYGQPLDVLSEDYLFKSIGATHTAFNPLKRFDKSLIVPSEVDDYYRYQVVQGYVHDMGAAMQGGVGGHAGLFSNANDVAKVMQMYLQGGYYGGKRFMASRTIEKFNKCYFCDKKVRRGVGFDKPQLEDKGPTCGCVSRKSFGHSGFTGTYTWADPEAELIYVFLSNRTYPKSSNTLLVRSELRTRIQQAIYDSLIN